jgi:hypothetical protein
MDKIVITDSPRTTILLLNRITTKDKGNRMIRRRHFWSWRGRGYKEKKY